MTGRTLCELSTSGRRGVYVGGIESGADGIDFLGRLIGLGKSPMPVGYTAGRLESTALRTMSKETDCKLYFCPVR